MNQIVMSDFRCNVVREFVRFLYTDTCCDASMLMQHARSLLALAHKYEVNERYLVSTLSADNAVELLQLPDVFGCKELKKHACTSLSSLNSTTALPLTHLPLTAMSLQRLSREDSRRQTENFTVILLK